VQAALHACILRVEAQDDNEGMPVIQPSSASREYGRGMMLVQQLAERWGVDKRSPSKAVWFEAIVLHRKP